jgi:hypothetical protein
VIHCASESLWCPSPPPYEAQSIWLRPGSMPYLAPANVSNRRLCKKTNLMSRSGTKQAQTLLYINSRIHCNECSRITQRFFTPTSP